LATNKLVDYECTSFFKIEKSVFVPAKLKGDGTEIGRDTGKRRNGSLLIIAIQQFCGHG
jgi:hypothetical protein